MGVLRLYFVYFLGLYFQESFAFNLFVPNTPFLYPLKTENVIFVFRR